jgi:hypothetical protein
VVASGGTTVNPCKTQSITTDNNTSSYFYHGIVSHQHELRFILEHPATSYIPDTDVLTCLATRIINVILVPITHLAPRSCAQHAV